MSPTKCRAFKLDGSPCGSGQAVLNEEGLCPAHRAQPMLTAEDAAARREEKAQAEEERLQALTPRQRAARDAAKAGWAKQKARRAAWEAAAPERERKRVADEAARAAEQARRPPPPIPVAFDNGWIEDKQLWKAVQFACALRREMGVGLAVHKAATYYEVDPHDVAVEMGRRAGFVKRNRQRSQPHRPVLIASGDDA